MTCSQCGQPARLFIDGTLEPEQFFSPQNTYVIAAGERNQRLSIYVCNKCGHGFTRVAGSSKLVENWYKSGAEDQIFLADEASRRVTSRAVLKSIEHFVQRQGRLLDVGCGPGIFVSEAVNRGWNVTGLEASVRAVDLGQQKFGVSLTTGDMDTLKTMPAQAFEVVTMFDVIEHVVDPATLIELTARVLKPNGYLVLTTPKFDSFLARLMGKYWYCIFPAHIHYFTNKSLSRLLNRAGFTIVKRRAHTRYLSLGYVWQRLVGFITGRKNVGIKAFHSTIIPVNFGDEFEVYAKKTR